MVSQLGLKVVSGVRILGTWLVSLPAPAAKGRGDLSVSGQVVKLLWAGNTGAEKMCEIYILNNIHLQTQNKDLNFTFMLTWPLGCMRHKTQHLWYKLFSTNKVVEA